ncbi:ABC transporter permease [Nocardioides sp. KR10-350]|uniref:ABC transporter permease n=1 Tax=Nocardioides cheoyonin TaxID=3156615 RepID=UPI0032B46B93
MTTSTVTTDPDLGLPEPRAAAGTGRRTRGAIPPVGVILASLVVLLLVAWAIAPGVFAHGDPRMADLTSVLQPPSAHHWLGTDRLGRDVLTRVIHGARYSLLIALCAVVISAVVGTLLGVLAGTLGKVVDELLSRVFDLVSAFPAVLLALLVVALAGSGTLNISIAIGIAGVPKFARVVRAETRLVRNADYVRQGVLYGATRGRTFVRHLLPNVLTSIPVLATIDIGTTLMAVSALSFLGLGPQPPLPEWGLMLSEARDGLRIAWWPGVFPGLAIAVTVIAFTVVGRYWQRRFEGRFA